MDSLRRTGAALHATAPGGVAPAAARVEPYAALAPLYDRLVGDSLHPLIIRSFERCRRQLGIDFDRAADVGCGTGVFLRHLLRDGVPLVGVDRSRAMLRIAARTLPPGRVLLLEQDVRSLQLPAPVDLITCNGDTLNYLTTQRALAQALSACSENLTPGGHFVGDLLTGRPPGRVPQLDVTLRGRASRWRASVNPQARLTVVDIDCEGQAGSKRRWSRERHVQKWHSLAELAAQLRHAGLRLRAWCRLDAAPASASGWIQVVAHKA
jgi:SAM-dependent methyltransferase